MAPPQATPGSFQKGENNGFSFFFGAFSEHSSTAAKVSSQHDYIMARPGSYKTGLPITRRGDTVFSLRYYRVSCPESATPSM